MNISGEFVIFVRTLTDADSIAMNNTTPHVSGRSKEVVINTLLLFFRLSIMLGVGLYTMRTVVGSLGPVDFGIFVLIAGFIPAYMCMAESASSVIAREIGEQLSVTPLYEMRYRFNATMTLQLFSSVVLFFCVQPIGMWLLHYHMDIPADRLVMARWAYTASLASFSLVLFSLPYHAMMLAHGKMVAYASFGFVQTALELFIALSIASAPMDKLLFYALALLGSNIVITIGYIIYCFHSFDECSLRGGTTKAHLKVAFMNLRWNFFGGGDGQMLSYFTNILINPFFGPILNALWACAYYLDQGVEKLVAGFNSSLSPLLMKTAEYGDAEHLFRIMNRGAKFSFYIALLFSAPLILEAPVVLRLWLGDHFLKMLGGDFVYLVTFLRLALLTSLASVLQTTITKTVQVSSDKHKFQVVVGLLGVLSLPVLFVLYKLGAPVQTVFVVLFGVAILQSICRLFMLYSVAGFNVMEFYRIISKCVVVSFCTFVFPILVRNRMPYGVDRLLVVSGTCIGVCILSILLFGLSKYERTKIKGSLGLKTKNAQ